MCTSARQGKVVPPTLGNTACPDTPSGSSALLSVGRKQRTQVTKAEMPVPTCPEHPNHTPTHGKVSATAGTIMVSALLMFPSLSPAGLSVGNEDCAKRKQTPFDIAHPENTTFFTASFHRWVQTGSDPAKGAPVPKGVAQASI